MKKAFINDYLNSFQRILSVRNLICGLIAIICAMFTSCSTMVQLPDGTKVKRPSKKEVIAHLRDNNVESLIYDYTCQSKLNSRIYDHLDSIYPYSSCSYGKLNQYVELSNSNQDLKKLFEDKVLQYETDVLYGFSSKSVKEIADYYKSHADEHVFLNDAIQQVYVAQMDSMEYTQIRELDRCFRHTIFSDTIHVVRMTMKESLMPSVRKAVNDYCKKELDMLAFVAGKTCKKKALQFMPYAMDKISDKIIDENLPVSSQSIAALYQKAWSAYYPKDRIQRMVNEELRDLSEELYEGRKVLASELDDFIPKTAEVKLKVPQIPSSKAKCPTKTLLRLSQIQHQSSGFSLKNFLLEAAGYLVGGLPGIALSAYDIYSSYKDAKAEANAMSPYIKAAINQIGKNINNSIVQDVRSLHLKARKSLINNQERFKKSIYDNF